MAAGGVKTHTAAVSRSHFVWYEADLGSEAGDVGRGRQTSFSSHPMRLKDVESQNTDPISGRVRGGGGAEGAHSSRAAGWCEPCPLISYHEVLCLSDVRQHQYCFHLTLVVWRRVGRLEGNWNRLQTPPKIETTLESVWAKGPLKFFHSCLENECLMTPCWKRLWLVNWIRWKVLPKLPSNEVRLWTDDEEELLGKITLEDQVVRHNGKILSHGPTVPHGRYVWWRRLTICCYSGEKEESEKLVFFPPIHTHSKVRFSKNK